jgi:hypothetical protein
MITYALITFICPMALGAAVGFSLGWSAPAAILLGSLFASHTLLLYPTLASIVVGTLIMERAKREVQAPGTAAGRLAAASPSSQSSAPQGSPSASTPIRRCSSTARCRKG